MELSEYLKLGLKDLYKPKQSNRIIQFRQLRQNSRDKCTLSQRHIAMMETVKINARMQAMLAWKAEKKLKEEQNKQKLKPIFKVSKVVAPSKLEDIYTKKVNNSLKLVETGYKFKPPTNIKPIVLEQRNSSKINSLYSVKKNVATKRIDRVKNINSNTLNVNFKVNDKSCKVSNALNVKPKVIKMRKDEANMMKESNQSVIKNRSPRDRNIMDVSESSNPIANENFVKENSMSRNSIINIQTPKKVFRKRLYGTACYIRKC
ncbi:PREDICTED: uncharacterized protein LOC108560180 isoform X2 [Nicrophorus vespilloides]|uniref:Uncharacterized protein LOC108560180 isoform X2 n=1 Tax=Nicrophorus vespilloides TaxID=110193 RepID=A0ABM1MEX2_NICVS|nr:PREDICTED: uncharacterized protein LOC108560180 isoform X2 [Nicrophorus vespilloides]